MRNFSHSYCLGRQLLSYVTWRGLTLALFLCAAPPAIAHQTSLHASIVSIADAPLSITIPGSLHVSPNRGGSIQLKLRNVLDPITGKGVNRANNTAIVDVVINGVAQSLIKNFDLKSGGAQISFPKLDLIRFDLVEIHGAVVKNSEGVSFGTMGLKLPGTPLSSAIIQVQNTPSPITLAPTRDADTKITANGGELSLRLDQILPPDTTNNRVEVEYAVNGGAPVVFSKHFDIVQGIALVKEPLGLATGDIVEVLRIDVYDSNNNRFATLGVRIMNP